MGLPIKHRRIELRLSDWIGFGLLAGMISLCLISYGEIEKLTWEKATGRVTGIGLPTDSRMIYSPISSTRNGVSILYEFEAGSRVVVGSWSSSWLVTPIARNLPRELQMTIENLRSVRITDVPRAAAPDLRLGTAVQRTPWVEELTKSLHGEDFYNISGVRRKSLAGVMPIQLNAKSLNRELAIRQALRLSGVQTPSIANRDAVIVAPEINVRFDPGNPSSSTLDYPGFNFIVPVVAINLLGMALTLGYFVRTYPALKLRGL